ncbi:unnamed protein product [Brassica oleracea var. botrytis]
MCVDQSIFRCLEMMHQRPSYWEIRRGMVQEAENSSGAIGAMLSADAATDCGLRFIYVQFREENVRGNKSRRDECAHEHKNESGTGKPTVIELLWKFYNPDEVITFDGFESAGMATAATRYGEPRTSSVL